MIAAHEAALGPSLGADPHDLDAWHAQVSDASARIRGELLDRLDHTNWKKANAQLEVIAGWPADPRTVDALVLRYERGFPAAITLDAGASRAALERLTGHRVWRTITALDVHGDWQGYVDFLSHAGGKPDRFHLLTDLLTALREQGHIDRQTKLKVETGRYTPQPDDLLRLRRAARGLL